MQAIEKVIEKIEGSKENVIFKPSPTRQKKESSNNFPTRKSPRKNPLQQEKKIEAEAAKGKREIKQSKIFSHPYTTKFGSAEEVSKTEAENNNQQDKKRKSDNPIDFNFNLNITQEILREESPDKTKLPLPVPTENPDKKNPAKPKPTEKTVNCYKTYQLKKMKK